MTQKILVTYASQAGSTAKVADEIGNVLRSDAVAVDVLPMKTVLNLSQYSAVIAGSAIHGQKWLPEAIQFINKHREELNRKPFASFMVCITLSMTNSNQYLAGLKEWMAPVRQVVRPLSEGYFAGGLDFSKLPFSFNVLMMRMVVLMGIWKTGDHIDAGAVRTWANNLQYVLRLSAGHG